jgi:glycosyltransferase involved in cell wall biosynthesis
LEASRIVLKDGANVDFIIVGGDANRFVGLKQWLLELMGLAQDVRKNLKEKIEQYNLQNNFHLLGATTDIQPVYEKMDVVCFPSHYDAPGRPVFEAAFSSVPSIVCVTHPKSDTLIDYETGIAIPAKDPEKLASAILFFVHNPTEISRMGANALKLAEDNFSPTSNASKLLEVYKHVFKGGALDE